MVQSVAHSISMHKAQYRQIIDGASAHPSNFYAKRPRLYSVTPPNGYPSTTDTCDITDNSECLDCIFNTFKPPQQRTPSYSV